MTAQTDIPVRIAEAHQAYVRDFLGRDCTGQDMSSDETSTWTCHGCGFRAVNKHTHGVRADQWVAGRHDPSDQTGVSF